MKSVLIKRSVASCAVLALGASAWANGVRIADRPQLGSFTTIQSAVDAAVDGETLVVATGSYAGFVIDNKKLAVVAAPAANAQVQGTIEVKNLGGARWVVLTGLTVTGATKPSPQFGDPALRLSNDNGHVQVEGCTLKGGVGSNGVSQSGYPYQLGHGGDGVELVDCTRVSFASCTLQGGNGGFNNSTNYETRGGDGGYGVDALRGTVALYDCTVKGGKGGNAGLYGGYGGDAYEEPEYGLIASNTSFTGGAGGDAWDFIWTEAGDGGSGLELGAAGEARLLDCTTAGGAGGMCWACDGPGDAGDAFEGTYPPTILPGESRKFVATPLTADLSTWNVTVTGLPGDVVLLKRSDTPAFNLAIAHGGVWLASGPLYANRRDSATIPASGQVTLHVVVGDLTGPSPARFEFLQGLAIDPLGNRFVSSPVHRLTLDRAVLPDCNANTVNDLVDVTVGGVLDADHNLMPDSCDSDCNGNGQADGFDLQSGTSHDCNANAIPDECDIAAGTSLDCNGNGYPDTCDIASHSSPDGNGNGVPDECEPNHVWHVDVNASPGGDGSAAAPFQTISQGLSASIAGDTVLVHDGTYVGAANRNLSFAGKNLVLQSTGGAANCVIDGEFQAQILSITFGSSSASAVDGITFRRGGETYLFQGGGLLINGASPAIRNCVFDQCLARTGAGVYVGSSNSRFENCTFRNNTAPGLFNGDGFGAGAFVSQGNVTLARCAFVGNSAQQGAGLYWSNGQSFPAQTFVVSHCTFLGNQAQFLGGAILARGSSSQPMYVDDCLIAGNVANSSGGALWSFPVSSGGTFPLTISNSTIVANTATSGGAWYAKGGITGRIYNSILWGNQAGVGHELTLDMSSPTMPPLKVEYSDVQGGPAEVWVVQGTLDWAGGNLAVDPQFADPVGGDGDPSVVFDNNYRLLFSSPCADAGRIGIMQVDYADVDHDGDVDEKVPFDLDLHPRRTDDPFVTDTGLGNAPLVDLGCYEWQP